MVKSCLGHVEVTGYTEKKNAFVFAAKAHTNAALCSVRRIEIDFQPIAEIVNACNKIFESIDRDDDFQCGIARDAWRLKITSTLTVLPFNDERLNLDALTRSMENAVSSVPEIARPVNAIRRAVDLLLVAPSNPKRERLLEMMVQMIEPGGEPVAILTNLYGVSTPGWPNDINEQDFADHATKLVRNRKDIADDFYSGVIIPGNPKFSPRKILFDLMYGGRSPQVAVLCYRAERAWIPVPARMPADRLFSNNATVKTVQEEVEVIEPATSDLVDSWVSGSIWDSIRHRHGNPSPVSDRDVRVRARFVLFADGSGSFLPEDGRVVEISDKFDLGRGLDAKVDILPRKPVSELEEGDLVMMRLSGSGDYLDDVADDLIIQAGEGKLRQRALEWKNWLNRTLKQQGEGVVARKLRELKVSLRSPQYLWAWAGDAVMAPYDLPTFLKLIQGIHELDPAPSDFDVNAYATARWNDMELVKAFHQKAGSAIRTALLSGVRDLINKRQRVDTVQTIELSGVESGKMGLMRVSAVDVKTLQIPLSRMFRLEKIGPH